MFPFYLGHRDLVAVQLPLRAGQLLFLFRLLVFGAIAF
jgi:hypothetical protein